MRPITAADLMNSDILTAREEMTVRQLADFLTDAQITGAPVVDAEGKLVGVVSVVDIVAQLEGSGLGVSRDNPNFFVRGWEDELSVEDMRGFHVEGKGLLVRDIMTPAVYSVSEEATVSEVASVMLDGHLHRILVKRDDEAVGIISTSDLLGLLVDEG